MAWSTRSRHERGYGSAWVKTRDRIMVRDKHLCQPCLRKGRPTPATAVDHIKPKAKGGIDDEDNLEATCAPCHAAKTTAEAAEAQGRSIRPRTTFDKQGNPIWPD